MIFFKYCGKNQNLDDLFANLQTVSPTSLRSVQRFCIYCNDLKSKSKSKYKFTVTTGSSVFNQVSSLGRLSPVRPSSFRCAFSPAKIIFIDQTTPNTLSPNKVLGGQVETSGFVLSLTHGVPNGVLDVQKRSSLMTS